MPAKPQKGTAEPNSMLPPVRLGALSRRILSSAADAVLPDDPAKAARLKPSIDAACEFLAYLPKLSQRLFPIGLLILQLGTILSGYSWRPFSCMSRERRRIFLRRLGRARLGLLRQLSKGIRGVVLLGYYELPEVQNAIGYAPEPFVRPLIAERKSLYGHRGLPVVTEPHSVRAPAATDGAASQLTLAKSTEEDQPSQTVDQVVAMRGRA